MSNLFWNQMLQCTIERLLEKFLIICHQMLSACSLVNSCIGDSIESQKFLSQWIFSYWTFQTTNLNALIQAFAWLRPWSILTLLATSCCVWIQEKLGRKSKSALFSLLCKFIVKFLIVYLWRASVVCDLFCHFIILIGCGQTLELEFFKGLVKVYISFSEKGDRFPSST